MDGIEVTILTPGVTAQMNDALADGKTIPYVYFAFSEADYISFSQWLQDVLRFIKQQNAVIEFYQSGERL